MRSASRWSWPVTPSVASMTSRAMSASSTARKRSHERVVLGAIVDLRPSPHARRVDEHDRAVLGLDHRVDRVACRARHVVHDGAVVADQTVEQRRLADVRPPDDRDAGDSSGSRPRPASVVGGIVDLGRDSSTSASSRSPVPTPVERAHRDRLAEAQRQELPDVILAAPRCRPCWRRGARAAWRAAASPRRFASSSVTPTVASTTNSTTSASRTARSACAADLLVERRPSRASSRRCRRP